MIRITVKTKSPLYLASGYTVGTLGESLDYIPGRAVRGALAAGWLEESPVDRDFNHIFLDHRRHFGPLLPVGKSQIDHPSQVVPLTALTCKHKPGFRGVGDGVRDSLLTYLSNTLATHQCSKCQQPLKAYSGYYAVTGSGPVEKVPSKRLITRTAIDPQRETARREQLFSQLVIEEGEYFSGYIGMGDRKYRNLLLNRLQNSRELYMGGGRSRGQGLLEIVDVAGQSWTEQVHDGSSLKQRLIAFNERAVEEKCINRDESLFTLTFHSDTILYDRFMRPKGKVEAEDLARYCDNRLTKAVAVETFSRTIYIEGWNAAQGLPVRTATALQTGSVVAVKTVLSIQELISMLEPIEKYGFGERTLEGFGRVKVCDPFHLFRGQV